MLERALIRTERLGKQYATAAGPVPVLKNVDLAIEPGEFVAIMGPSGLGKSTFMNILGCLDLPTSGRYTLDGRDVGALDSGELARLRNSVIGFVFQGYNLLPRATLADNVALPLIYGGVSKVEGEKRAHELLEQMDLALRGLCPRPGLGRTAAARGDRACARQSPAAHPRRRDYRQSGHGDQPRTRRPG
jgi:putative ABC transport system ATP-binding protein